MRGPDHITQAARIAAEVAARYGCPVSPDVVQVVPLGTSGIDLPVWDGKHLVYADPQGWKQSRAVTARREFDNPAITARRAHLARLHADGLQDAAIAAALSVSQAVVKWDRKRLHLPANLDRITAEMIENRRLALHRMVAAGDTLEVIAGRLGLARSYTQKLLRDKRLMAARTARPLRPRATRALPADKTRLGRALARRARLRALLEESGGAPDAAAQRAFMAAEGITRRLLWRDLDHLGVKLPARPGPVKGDTCPKAQVLVDRKTRRAALAVIFAPGLSIAALARHLQVSRETLRGDLIHLGLTASGKHPGMPPGKRAEVEARRAAIADLTATGATRSQMARALGLTTTTISRHLEALGLTVPHGKCGPGPGPRGLTKGVIALRARLLEMRARGLTIAAMAAETGKGLSTVSQHLTDLGVTRPRRLRKPVGD